ncbi:reverse transcriptase N-terminal domain-containing protein [Nocardia sp. KC 131]|uniref:reverse transcriptase N-terminal domain-containing protein n=1 Tax=Nocardia arseniciresistens TaxID=3392119 RepID=UPI00398E580A
MLVPSNITNRRDKLDTVEVNGPQGAAGLVWGAVDWRAHEQNVARLRRRIFQATRNRDWAQVRSLQKLMLVHGRTRC